MEHFVILTRDVNGNKTYHYIDGGGAHGYILEQLTDDDEILLVLKKGACIYSSLMAPPITKEDLVRFFA